MPSLEILDIDKDVQEKTHSIYGIYTQYYWWFQASAGSAGMYPPWLRRGTTIHTNYTFI